MSLGPHSPFPGLCFAPCLPARLTLRPPTHSCHSPTTTPGAQASRTRQYRKRSNVIVSAHAWQFLFLLCETFQQNVRLNVATKKRKEKKGCWLLTACDQRGGKPPVYTFIIGFMGCMLSFHRYKNHKSIRFTHQKFKSRASYSMLALNFSNAILMQ